MQPNFLPTLVERVLGELLLNVGAEGLAVVRLGSGGRPVEAVCTLGTGIESALSAARPLLERALREPVEGYGSDRRPVTAARVELPNGSPGVIALWRGTGAGRWRDIGIGVVTAAAGVASALLSHSATSDPITTLFDPLTEMSRRRRFFTELRRHFERLDHDQIVGTLILVDIDKLERTNQAEGQQERNALLVKTATRLRAIVRPHDLVAHLGESRFALWLGGMDHLAAAERADALRAQPILLSPEASSCKVVATLSVGIATRWPGSSETVQAILLRAEAAVCQVKSDGGGHWRVSPAVPPPQRG